MSHEFGEGRRCQLEYNHSNKPMIEHCVDILTCEQILSKEVKNVRLLGEILFSSDDLENLAELIHQIITPSISKGTRYLEQKAPTCFACFLVWTGIVGYREGNYWSAVQESIGLADPSWQMRWGRIFINYLQENELPEFYIEGGHKYLTPILTHGGIPDSCLTEFFDGILLPLVQRGLLDPTNRQEIVHELTVLRSDHHSRIELEWQVNELQKKHRELKVKSTQFRQLVKAYDEVVRLLELEELASEAEEQSKESAVVEEQLADNLNRFQVLEREIQAQEKKRAEGEQFLTHYYENEDYIVVQNDEIERAILNYAGIARKNVVVTNLEIEGGPARTTCNR